MIDKQNLLQWISDKKYVFSEPYDTKTHETVCKSINAVLNRLEQSINSGEFEIKKIP